MRASQLLVLLGLAGCEPHGGAAGAVRAPIVVHDAGSFSESARADGTVTLFEDASTVIAALGTIALTQDSLLLMSDLWEANVKVYALDGTLVQRFGSKGDGPGEYRRPAQVSQGADGSYHVVDLQTRLVTIVDRRGEYVRQVSLGNVPNASAVYPLEEDRYLVVGADPGSGHVLFFMDDQGEVESSHLPIAFVRPRVPQGSPVAEVIWTAFRSVNTAMIADSLYVMLPHSDTLWVFSPSSREYSAAQLEIAGYEPPGLPPDDWMNNNEAFNRWVASHHAFRGLKSVGGSAWINMVRGQGADAEKTALTNFPDGTWRAYTDAPSITAGTPPYLYSVQSDSTTTLRRYIIK